MRCAHAPFIAVLIIVAAVGCRNQTAPLRNPFLTPDRVPPPSTRVLTPGTAQPYYPGDPLPGAAPIGSFPATNVAPPTGAYPSGPAYPVNPVMPTPTAPIAPPGGWNGYPSQAQSAPTADPIRVPNDDQQLRFAAVAQPQPVQVQPAPAAAPAFTPNAGAPYPVQQAAFNEPAAVAQPTPQRLQIREIDSAEYLDSRATASTSIAPPSRDGFRPQSGAARAEQAGESSIAKGFRSPSLATNAVATSGSSKDRFGVGPKQEWLRGQLEYWPETGEWSIRYMGDGPVDQIGGRVLIDNPQVLGNLPPGEFVMVEGQLYGRQIDEASWRPAYRVATVQRQRTI